ncbi:hypothetical protein [Streptomyces sp. enrichment culture]|uniref:hypothetical protein n=1 Tax=Streptomyces sp. enrichment culture TaxID=1795815 RepID=UPI003F55D439
MRRISRRVAAATAALLGLGGAVAPPAAAAEASKWYLHENGVYRGTLAWQQDPSGSRPGDALRICDDVADGRGVEARLIVDAKVNRIVTTQGHSSPYCTDWKTGNLTEGRKYPVLIYVMSNNKYTYIGSVEVTA